MSDKLISANKLMEYINGSIEAMTKVGVAVDGEYLWGLINYAIEDAPTIDAELVVRCCDCKYLQCNMRQDGNLPFGVDEYECRHWCGSCDPTDFCSYGERREDVKVN